MEGTSVIASIITEIRGDMSDKEFSAALNTFTKGEYHPATNTIQKYRTGQREPSYCDLQKILAYSEAGDHLSHGTATRLAEFFGIPQLAQRADESAQVAHHLLPGSVHLSTSGKVDELAQTHLSDLTQQLQMRPQQGYANEHYPHSSRNTFDEVIEIPIYKQIPVSEQVESEDDFEGYMTMPKKMLIGNDYFYLKVSDEAFTDVSIHNGDLVLVRKSTLPENDQLVVARLNNQEVVCKTLYKIEDGRIILLPSPAGSQPLNPTEIEFIGIVEKVLRNY